jgi:prepilin-type N-terminal cleavage/methylation domain-containing protein
MILNNIKTRQKDSGFTIVELLVVIVVIGILAAITIVSYTGITARAKTAQAQANANSVVQLVNAYTSDSTANNGGNGTYPANVAAWASYTTTTVPSGVTVSNQTAGHPASTDGTNTIFYLPKGTTGGCISYWDTNANAAAFMYVGNATTDVPATPSCS